MTLFSFDSLNQSEVPAFYLANPDETILYNLGTIYNRNVELRFNTLSTLTFTAPSSISGSPTDYYDYLEYRRLVYIDGIACFMITGIETNNDGIVELKEVTCQSLEVIMSYKKVSLFKGTYTFNNTISSGSGFTPSNSTKNLFTDTQTGLMNLIPGWTLNTSYITPSLRDTTRTFDVSDKSLYDFLVNDVSQTYQCVFVFDSLNKTITPYPVANATTATDIFISFDNLMKSFTKTESTEELITAMNVFGGKGILVDYVNPLGGNTIYNFDYYKDTEWMNQDLIDALDVWETGVSASQVNYANLLTSLRTETSVYISLESDLYLLEAELAALNLQYNAAVQGQMSTTEISGSITATNGSIVVVEQQLAVSGSNIDDINYQMVATNEALSFENNFTASQLSNLNNFIIGNTYTNTNFIATSIMSEVDIQNISQELYDQATSNLIKLAQPRYMFDIESANFAFIKDFEPFIAQLAMGCTITVELEPDVYTTAVLLGIDFNYDDPTQFKLTLSNRNRLDDEEFQYSDLYGSTVDAGVTSSFNYPTWNETSNAYSDLIAGGNTIVTATNASSEGNLALFYDTTGTRVTDGGALYSTGSFSPSLSSTGWTYTYSPTPPVGRYNILGRTLFFELTIEVSASSGTGANPTYIVMPIPLHKQLANLNASFKPVCSGIGFARYTNIVGIMPSNSGSIALYKEGENLALASVSGSTIVANSKIYLTGNYLIN